MTEIRLGEPRSEGVGKFPKRTLFDMVENPEVGWTTRRIKRIYNEMLDSPEVWEVELIQLDGSGATIACSNESLFIAWARATEQAHMQNKGLN